MNILQPRRGESMKEQIFFTQSSVQAQVNNVWDRRKEKYTRYVWLFSISITWTNERKLNFRWLPYFRSGNLQGENRTMIINNIKRCLFTFVCQQYQIKVSCSLCNICDKSIIDKYIVS